jgi:hypothetical protein
MVSMNFVMIYSKEKLKSNSVRAPLYYHPEQEMMRNVIQDFPTCFLYTFKQPN